VRNCHSNFLEQETDDVPDANLFKDSFLKAQKENEEIFNKAKGEEEAGEKAEDA
jgi:hypothetical protein